MHNAAGIRSATILAKTNGSPQCGKNGAARGIHFCSQRLFQLFQLLCSSELLQRFLTFPF